MDTDSPQTLAELIDSDVIKCKVCLRSLKEAKLLPCLDTVCNKCLDSVLKKRDENNQKSIVCPICYEPLNPPNIDLIKSNAFFEDLAELAECKNSDSKYCDYCNFTGHKIVATGWCLECKDNLCTTCTSAHQKTKITRSHAVAPFKEIKNHRYDHDIRESQTIPCAKHDDKNLTEYCVTCDELVCAECSTGDHKEHTTNTGINTAGEKLNQQLSSLIENLDGKDPDLVKSVEFMKKYIEELNSNEKQVEERVKNHAETLHALINERRDHLLETMHTRVTTEICDVENKMKRTNQILNVLRNNLRFVNTIRRHGKHDERLDIARTLRERLTRLIDLESDRISSKLKLDFNPGNANEQNIEVIFGQLSSKAIALENGTRIKRVAGSEPRGLTISNVLPTVNNITELIVEFEASSRYDERDIWPCGLGVTSRDEYVIVDRENKRVKIYANDGKFVRDFTGSDEHALGCPYDAAVLPDGNIAITDYESDEVKIFTTNGEYIRTITGYFKHPRGIAVNSDGEIIVVDCGTLQVTIHNPDDGAVIRTIKGQDEEGFEFFTDPYYVAVMNNDNIIVTDWAAPNIKVFSASGKFLAKYGTYGIKQDQILEPYGVCTDAFGYIFVADNQNHRIHLLLPDGRFHKFILSKMNGLWHPMAIAINNDGHLVITEALGKVRVYKYI
ncbi:E3 ubiquitin-protein ligase TRIM56-like [Tubulanus polymorphus]|uniref:E3 ubiquitin-protein ligase TRIM56-like n=1 Tax=Tubulanus polymorphus TaxID=672921 RepID=UPI003DA29C5C